MFQSSPAFRDFQQMLANPAFELACNAALMTFIEGLPQHTSAPTDAWDCHCQIVGAKKVLEKLSELHIKDESLKREPWPTLNYESQTTKSK